MNVLLTFYHVSLQWRPERLHKISIQASSTFYPVGPPGLAHPKPPKKKSGKKKNMYIKKNTLPHDNKLSGLSLLTLLRASEAKLPNHVLNDLS